MTLPRDDKSGARRRWLSVGALLLLAPVCAEYVSAYNDSTGRPLVLLGQLVVFVPLYGCAALLIREVARRAGLGWVGIIGLAVAFGLVEAGIVDQSLFSPEYRQIEGWDAMYRTTLIPALGVSVSNALIFIGGHVLYTICGPIALVEAARPDRATQPWLGRVGLTVTAIAYAAACVVVLRWHLATEDFRASAGQLTGTALLVAALVAGAVLLGRRPRRPDPRPAPGLLRTALLVLPLALLQGLAPETWPGVVMRVLAAAGAVVLLVRLARRPGWTPAHAAVAAAVPLLLLAVLAFTYDPLVGEVARSAKYGHNATMLALLLAATALAVLRRSRLATSRVRALSSRSRQI